MSPGHPRLHRGAASARVVAAAAALVAASCGAEERDGPGATCALTSSGPIEVVADGQVIEDLRITSLEGPAIRVEGHAGVVIRNVEIRHAGGPGIELTDADDTVIQDVAIEHTGAPAGGANASDGDLNISCYGSARLRIERARLTRGSSGVYLLECPGSALSFIEGHDFRGPFPRGQLVQWDKSSDGLLEDFSVISPSGSWPEDNVNVYQSLGVTVRRGHIDGNDSPSGVGVIFDGGDAVGLVEDVDAIRMGNGCFSAYAGGAGSVFRRTRCRENLCGDQGRGPPLSSSLMWSGNEGVTGLHVEDSRYFASCNGNVVWPDSSFVTLELEEEDFAMRPPIVNEFCWE